MWSRPGHLRVAGSKQVTSHGPNYSVGLYQTQYNGFPNSNVAVPSFFSTATVVSHTTASNFDITLTSAQTSIGYQWVGYFKPNVSGNWTFTGYADDCITLWVGSNAVSNATSATSVVNVSDTTVTSGNVSLNAGTYYPIRVQYANNQGPGSSFLHYTNGQASNSNSWNGMLFYNPVTNGF